MQIIDGRKIRDEILEELKKEVELLSFDPMFCDILVGDDPVSSSYVRIKEKMAESIGVKFRTANFPVDITNEAFIEEIENLNRVPYMCGIIVQLPLPNNLDKDKILDAIDPKLDVDCLNRLNSEKFYNDEKSIIYPTALACIKILESIPIDLDNKKILVLGRGSLVGKPIAHILSSRGFSVDTIDSKTENKDLLIKEADIIISAIGKGKFITSDLVKKDVVIIDAGTSEEDGGIVGDVDLKSVEGVASYVTPCPGGVGPVTVAMLLGNVLEVAKTKNSSIGN